MKECSNCKRVMPLDEFHKNSKGRFGRQAKCKACTRSLYYEPNKEKVMARTASRRSTEEGRAREREQQRARRNENRMVRLLQEAKVRATKRGLLFDLSLSDVPIPDVCPVLGIPIRLDAEKRADSSPSLDRVDGALGYVRGNVRVISWRANRLKSDASLEEMEALVRYIKAHAWPALGVAVTVCGIREPIKEAA